MSKDQDIDDPTCVIKLLDEFRSCKPRPSNFLGNKPVLAPSKLEFNDSTSATNLIENTPISLGASRSLYKDSVTEPSQKKRKCYDSTVLLTPNTDSRNDSMEIELPVAASPWDVRHLRATVVQLKAQNANLENQIKKYHALRKETEVLFENEKKMLQKQHDWDQERIKSLEDRMSTLRKRKEEYKDELSQCRQSMEKNKFYFEKKILSLQAETTQLKYQNKELELSNHKNEIDDRRISELEAELTLSVEEIAAFKHNAKSLEGKAVEVNHLKHQIELAEQQLTEAKQKIKELENNLEDGKELRDLLEKQQDNLKRFPELEREIVSLKEENKNLRDAVHNKLILEEEVIDLRTRQANFEEREQQLIQFQAAKEHLESMLEKWQKLARDHCIGVPPEKAISGPELLRIRIETLQQKELLFTSDLANVESRLKSIQHAKSLVDAELEKASKQIEKLQTVNEQHDILIKRLQKKLILVSRERDSYRSQLDLYEKELTISSTATLFSSSQHQQQKSRIEALEKAVEGYRELVEKLEGDSDKSSRISGGNQLTNERFQKLEEERDALRQEKEELMKRRDELEIELEYRALKGDFNPTKSKVLHFRMNPAAEAEMKQQNEILKLQQECDQLRERLKLIEEGQKEDLTVAVNARLATCNSQEIEELQKQVKSKDTKIQRLTEVYKATSQEFRDVCYMLVGYRIDRMKSGLYRLSSMYAESQDDHLIFKLTDGNPELLETPYSLTLEDFINLHLKHQHSIPVFLSAITLDLFNRQTVASSYEVTSS